MAVFQSVSDLPPVHNRSIVIGTFDGLHHGHKHIIREALKDGLSPLAITFSPHPRTLLSPGYAPPLLTTDTEKIHLFRKEGVEDVLLLPFERYLHLTADQFLGKVVKPLNPKRIVVGFNFFFGRNQSGSAEYLLWWCKPYGIEVTIVPPVIRHGIRVSSSSVRELVLLGKIEQANDMLSRPLFYTGHVIRGKQLGKAIGFPTVNMTAPNKVLPPRGVYASTVSSKHGVWKSVTNIGTAPTVTHDNNNVILETHIVESVTNPPSYGESALIRLFSFLRPERKFASNDLLKAAVQEDVVKVRQFFSKNS